MSSEFSLLTINNTGPVRPPTNDLSVFRLRGRSLLSTGGFSCSRRTWRGPRSVSPPLLRNLLRLLMLLMNQNGKKAVHFNESPLIYRN